jgi:hypothetical protein
VVASANSTGKTRIDPELANRAGNVPDNRLRCILAEQSDQRDIHDNDPQQAEAMIGLVYHAHGMVLLSSTITDKDDVA